MLSRYIYYYNADKNSFSGAAVYTGYFARGTQPTEKCDKHIEVLYDRVTGGICFDDCTCPDENLITVSFRLNNERAFDSYVAVLDGDCIYKAVPVDYEYPTDPSLPFFANMYPADTFFGITTQAPRNRVCPVHGPEDEPEESDTEVSGE